jgi:uncharacterized OB-fold protein
VSEKDQPAYGDPLSEPFWAAARRRQLVLQRCADCSGFQFYPRPFCLACQSDSVEWVPARGTGRVYSLTEVHMAPAPEFKPPYYVAVVELDEGPRLTTNLLGSNWQIGDGVQVAWRDRDGAPPLPLFEKAEPPR